MKYKFQDGQDGKAAKELKEHIKKSIEEKNGSPASDEQILNGWQFILDNWNKWIPFYQDQLKISQINSNLPNIMANIRGYNGKQYKPSAAETFATISEIVKSANGKI